MSSAFRRWKCLESTTNVTASTTHMTTSSTHVTTSTTHVTTSTTHVTTSTTLVTKSTARVTGSGLWLALNVVVKFSNVTLPTLMECSLDRMFLFHHRTHRHETVISKKPCNTPDNHDVTSCNKVSMTTGKAYEANVSDTPLVARAEFCAWVSSQAAKDGGGKIPVSARTRKAMDSRKLCKLEHAAKDVKVASLMPKIIKTFYEVLKPSAGNKIKHILSLFLDLLLQQHCSAPWRKQRPFDCCGEG